MLVKIVKHLLKEAPSQLETFKLPTVPRKGEWLYLQPAGTWYKTMDVFYTLTSKGYEAPTSEAVVIVSNEEMPPRHFAEAQEKIRKSCSSEGQPN